MEFPRHVSYLSDDTGPWLAPQMLPEKLEDLCPRIHGLLWPVPIRVVVPETVSRPVVAIEFVVFLVFLKLFFVPVHLFGRWKLVFVTEQSQERASQFISVIPTKCFK